LWFWFLVFGCCFCGCTWSASTLLFASLLLTTILVVTGAILLLCITFLQQTTIELLNPSRQCPPTWCTKRRQWRWLNQRIFLAFGANDSSPRLVRKLFLFQFCFFVIGNKIQMATKVRGVCVCVSVFMCVCVYFWDKDWEVNATSWVWICLILFYFFLGKLKLTLWERVEKVEEQRKEQVVGKLFWYWSLVCSSIQLWG